MKTQNLKKITTTCIFTAITFLTLFASNTKEKHLSQNDDSNITYYASDDCSSCVETEEVNPYFTNNLQRQIAMSNTIEETEQQDVEQTNAEQAIVEEQIQKSNAPLLVETKESSNTTEIVSQTAEVAPVLSTSVATAEKEEAIELPFGFLWILALFLITYAVCGLCDKSSKPALKQSNTMNFFFSKALR